jgi:serine/threonine protein phosphatase 1
VKPDEEKIFAVGDIHGCHRNLVELMTRLPFDRRRDTLVFLGDYINRGPRSREVIDYLLDLQADCDRTVFLMGNHEHALLGYAASGDVEMLHLLRGIGVEATLKSYGNATVRSLRDLSFLSPSHLAFLQSLVFSFRSGNFLFVHADTEPGGNDLRHPEQLLSSRRLAGAGVRPDGDVVVFGHTAFQTPLVAPGRIGIDTGACHGNLLTAVELPALRFYHA